MYSTTIANAG